jgi:hypothetical protein
LDRQRLLAYQGQHSFFSFGQYFLLLETESWPLTNYTSNWRKNSTMQQCFKFGRMLNLFNIRFLNPKFVNTFFYKEDIYSLFLSDS